MPVIQTEGLTRIYGRGRTAVVAVDHVHLSVEPGEFVAVMGPSGSGKSTLLYLIGGLDRPSEGRVLLEGQDLNRLSDEALARLRRRRVGFIFQFFNLITSLNALENVALPLILDGMKPSEAMRRAREWLERLGLGDRLDHTPDTLSGGEQQRVAIARALSIEPAVILADEPTGNLDSRTADEVAALLRRATSEWGRTVLMVTHNPRIAAYADRILFMKDGRIVDEVRLAGGADLEAAPMLRQRLEKL